MVKQWFPVKRSQARALTSGDVHDAVVPLIMLSAPVGWIARLSIGQKLAVSFGIILILLIGSFVAMLVYLSRVNGYVDRHQRITIPGVVDLPPVVVPVQM